MPAAPATQNPPATPPLQRYEGKIQKRVRTPTLIQIEAVECGAVSLGIILRHFGRFVPVEELRSACDISRSGSSALKVLKAARGYGLEAQGWKKEVHELGDLPLPFIVFWNFSHFLVVEGFTRDAVYLNDPAGGPRKCSIQEFDQSYTGVALTAQPGPDFQPGGKPPSLLRALAERLPAGSLGPILFLILTGLALAVTGLIVPTFQRVFVNDYLIDGKDGWVKPMLWFVLGTAIFTFTLTLLQSFILTRFSLQLAVRMEGSFLWYILRLPLTFFQQRFAGELAQRTTINDKVAGLLSGQLAHACVSLITILPYGLVLFTYNWLLSIVGLTIAVMNLVIMKLISRARVDKNAQLLQEQGVLTGTAITGFQNIESIKATASENDLFARLAGNQAKVIDSQQELARWSTLLSLAPKFLDNLNAMLMLILGGWSIIQGSFTIGGLLAFKSLMAAFLKPFSSLASLGGQLQNAEGEMRRLDDVLRTQLDPIAHDPGAGQLDHDYPADYRIPGRIELRDVTFGYSKQDPPLLQNVHLTLEPGQRIALVGSSGSGKSTLVMLIVGLLQPWSGEILFDGKPRTAYPRQLLARSLAYVSQQIYLFEGSIYDNIALFDNQISLDEVEQAAMDACIHDSITLRTGGYLAKVNEGGLNFSGGQMQRIEIARGLALNPSMLVLDEATSALDPMTELSVDQNIRKRQISCIISAHRLSTIRDANEIIVLHQGQIVERGHHDDLIAQQGFYAKLVES